MPIALTHQPTLCDWDSCISDFIDLASNFNKSGTWRDGDLNYDGTVTISDFIDLASSFNLSFAGSADPLPELFSMPQPASQPTQKAAPPSPPANSPR